MDILELLQILFVPYNDKYPKRAYLLLSGVPIGWCMVIISLIVSLLVKLI